MAFWKLLDQSYVQIVPSQQLQPHWQQHFERYPTGLHFTATRKNATRTWKNIWTKIETTFHLFYALLFLSNLVFKFNIVLIVDLLFDFHHNLFTVFCLLINIWYITDLEVCPVPLRFFIWANKNETRRSTFEAFQLQNVLIMFLFFHEKCLHDNGENYCWC